MGNKRKEELNFSHFWFKEWMDGRLLLKEKRLEKEVLDLGVKINSLV